MRKRRRELWLDAQYGPTARCLCRALCLEGEERLSPAAFSREAHGNALRNADLLTWGRHFLPDHFRLPPSEMHEWLAEQLDVLAADVYPRFRTGLVTCPLSLVTSPLSLDSDVSVDAPPSTNDQGQRTNDKSTNDKGQMTNDAPALPGLKLNCLGPRGSAKSTVVTLAFVLREALARRQPYIWIISDTRHQACGHLDAIKAELTDNPQIAALYPEACGVGPIWRRGAIVLRNGVMIEAFGTGQRIRGRRRREHRPTVIVCDDLQNDGHIQSAALRDQSRAWFHGLLMKAGTKRTTVIHLGTALHRECLAMELTHTPGWTSRTFKSIERWPDHMPLWAAWEELYCKPRIDVAPFSGRASGPQEPSAESSKSVECGVRSAESQASVAPNSELNTPHFALSAHSALRTPNSTLSSRSNTESANQDSNSTGASSGPLAAPLNSAEQNAAARMPINSNDSRSDSALPTPHFLPTPNPHSKNPTPPLRPAGRWPRR